MWQRIQTIWLVLVVALMCLLANLETGHFVGADGSVYLMDAWNILRQDALSVSSVSPIGILSYISAGIALVSIFLYKDSRGRTFQIRLGVLNIFVIIGILAYLGLRVYLFVQNNPAEALSYRPEFPLAIPFVAIVLQYLAVHAVLRDETLVRMSNRLR